MLKISKLSDYATVLMATLARAPDRLYTVQRMSELTQIPSPTVSKLVKCLAQRDLLTSARGSKGGYALARPAQDITMAEVLAAVEGGFALTECSHTEQLCAYEGHCHIQHKWQTVHRAFQQILEGVSVAQMASPLEPLNITISHEPQSQDIAS